jgi:hypothetical protein
MSTESVSDLKFELGHVLFIDIVGYSKLLITEESEIAADPPRDQSLATDLVTCPHVIIRRTRRIIGRDETIGRRSRRIAERVRRMAKRVRQIICRSARMISRHCLVVSRSWRNASGSRAIG